MGIFDFLKKQLPTVIEWQPQQNDILIWKYPALTDEIKSATKLIVSAGQGCLLVYEGKITDVFDQQGIFNIETDNFPFLTNLLKAIRFFESEHKVGLYYFRKANVVNQGWGTSSPIKYIDQQYQIPVQLATHGNFSYKLTDPKQFFENYAGTVKTFTTTEFREIVQSRIIQYLTSYFSKAQLTFNQIDAHLQDIAEQVKIDLQPEFQQLGAELSDFRIEGTYFDAETESRIGKIADLRTDTLAAAEGGLSFAELEKLKALRDAAKNEGGIAGVGASLAAGANLGQLFQDKVDQVMDNNSSEDAMQRLKKLKVLLDEQIISQEEFDEKKKEILKNF